MVGRRVERAMRVRAHHGDAVRAPSADNECVEEVDGFVDVVIVASIDHDDSHSTVRENDHRFKLHRRVAVLFVVRWPPRLSVR